MATTQPAVRGASGDGNTGVLQNIYRPQSGLLWWATRCLLAMFWSGAFFTAGRFVGPVFSSGRRPGAECDAKQDHHGADQVVRV